jgi:MFS transporter, DHA2 family, methylenomycin A resistance protein
LINVARLAGATIGVAVLGAVFALAGAGTRGLAVAMLLGGAIEIAVAATASMATPTEADLAPRNAGAG